MANFFFTVFYTHVTKYRKALNMNNRINNSGSVSFNARYLKFVKKEQIPKPIVEAITKNGIIDEFIKAGKPKTLWGKFKDLFNKNEILDVRYEVRQKNQYDPYSKKESILFSFGKGKNRTRFTAIKASQEGIRRQEGEIPKIGESPFYKAPKETSTEKIVKQIENIKDMDDLLK